MLVLRLEYFSNVLWFSGRTFPPPHTTTKACKSRDYITASAASAALCHAFQRSEKSDKNGNKRNSRLKLAKNGSSANAEFLRNIISFPFTQKLHRKWPCMCRARVLNLCIHVCVCVEARNLKKNLQFFFSTKKLLNRNITVIFEPKKKSPYQSHNRPITKIHSYSFTVINNSRMQKVITVRRAIASFRSSYKTMWNKTILSIQAFCLFIPYEHIRNTYRWIGHNEFFSPPLTPPSRRPNVSRNFYGTSPWSVRVRERETLADTCDFSFPFQCFSVSPLLCTRSDVPLLRHF